MKTRIVLALLAVISFAAYAHIFLALLPTAQGTMGSDYQYFLPQYLNGYFWFHTNGLWAVPWFTPAFCGGLPFYPNIQTMYYTVPQFLTFAFGPLAAVQATFLLFAGLGMAGFWILARRTFGLGVWAALLGAVLFLFNGFYAHRLLIGHLTFHPYMLTPLWGWLLLGESREDGSRSLPWRVLPGWRTLVAGLLFAYAFQSGMVHLFPPVLIILGCLFLTHRHLAGKTHGGSEGLPSAWGPWFRLAAAGCMALGICMAKLVAAAAWMRFYARDMLPLSGYGSPWQALKVMLTSVFLPPAHKLDELYLINKEWYPGKFATLGRHELEYGITLVPAVLLLAWCAWWLWQRVRAGRDAASAEKASAPLWRPVAVVLILVVPMFLNWYEPHWNAFLKSLPVLNSTCFLSRWFCLYTFLFIFYAVMALDRLPLPVVIRAGTACLGILVCILVNQMADRDYYRDQQYEYKNVEQAYGKVRRGEWDPLVSAIDAYVVEGKYYIDPLGRNDSLAFGGSQIRCYEPMFGPRMEAFPLGKLHHGKITHISKGEFNMKDPRCYLFPEANQCRPGDHLSGRTREAIEQTLDFIQYRPLPFAEPWWQKAANVASVVSLLAVMLLLAGQVVRGLLSRRP